MAPVSVPASSPEAGFEDIELDVVVGWGVDSRVACALMSAALSVPLIARKLGEAGRDISLVLTKMWAGVPAWLSPGSEESWADPAALGGRDELMGVMIPAVRCWWQGAWPGALLLQEAPFLLGSREASPHQRIDEPLECRRRATQMKGLTIRLPFRLDWSASCAALALTITATFYQDRTTSR